MNIEVNDNLFNSYRQYLISRNIWTDESSSINDLLSAELHRSNIPGWDKCGFTGLNTLSGLYIRIRKKHFGSGWKDVSNYCNTYEIIDIDHFRDINDNYGFHGGDEVIIDLANKLKNDYDLNNLFRIGGDEFLIILDDRKPKIYNLLYNATFTYSILELKVKRNQREFYFFETIKYLINKCVEEAKVNGNIVKYDK